MCARARSPSGQERQRSRQPRAREGEAGKAGVPRAPRREQVSLSAWCVFSRPQHVRVLDVAALMTVQVGRVLLAPCWAWGGAADGRACRDGHRAYRVRA
jgi:hypothetical protein